MSRSSRPSDKDAEPAEQAKRKPRWWEIVLAVVLALTLGPLILLLFIGFGALAALFYVGYSVCLHVIIWMWWCARGRDVLFVYSDSPIWRDYIEQRILPSVAHRAVILNWSQRKRWRASLASLAFYHFGGRYEFNPMAVVFRPLRLTRTFRFWKPFRDFKHGKNGPLETMEARLFAMLGVRR